MMLQGQRVLIGVGGGIAAYKVCEVVSTLAKAGASVRVILTESAQQFITPLTMATLSRHPAYTDADAWQPTHTRPLHIELGEWADLFLIAPLTANTLAKLTHGLADNLLTNTVLASTCPIVLAPAMNTDMWQQVVVQHNWHMLQADPRYHSIEPNAGILACDRVGKGRMAEPSELIAMLQSLSHTKGRRDLAGKHVLISTGGTQEYLDPVRFLGNPSSGRMGIALAEAVSHRGGMVTLVHAPLDAAVLQSISVGRRVPVVTANDMRTEMVNRAAQADWIIMAAAVADLRPTDYSPEKLPKQSLPHALPLTPVPDIAAELGTLKQPYQTLIGFAAQTGDILPPALDKLERKQLDVIVANPIDVPEQGFGSDRNQAILLDRHGRKQIVEPCPKLQLAHHIIDFVLATPRLTSL